MEETQFCAAKPLSSCLKSLRRDFDEPFEPVLVIASHAVQGNDYDGPAHIRWSVATNYREHPPLYYVAVTSKSRLAVDLSPNRLNHAYCVGLCG
jgi:hypothetical protein